MELAFQVRRNRKESTISGGLRAVFRGDKMNDEEGCRDMDSSFLVLPLPWSCMTVDHLGMVLQGSEQ